MLINVDQHCPGASADLTSNRDWSKIGAVRATTRLVPPRNTSRLRFRSWREDDLPLALGLWGDPRVTALIDARPQLDEAAVGARLAVEIATERAHGFQYWPMFDAADALVGACGLKPCDSGPGREAGLEAEMLEMGFYLRPPYWGLGLATEAARAVVAHAFEVVGATTLGAGHHPENAASKRTLEKLGFRYWKVTLFAPTGLMHPYYRLDR